MRGVGGRARASTSRDSYAYSDSYYDVPLLGAVGHPVVVNPDPRLRLLAWPGAGRRIYLDVPPACPSWPASSPSRRCCPFVRPELVPYARFDIAGTEHIPGDGPAILVRQPPQLLRRRWPWRSPWPSGAGPVRFLGKKEVFDAPVVGDLARAMGGIRVERGTGSDEPLQAAAARSRPARWWRSCRRAPSRGAGRSSTRSSRAGGARPGWPP